MAGVTLPRHKIMKWFLVALAAATLLFIAYSFWISRSPFAELMVAEVPAVAPREQALTFARTPSRLLLVTGHGAETVRGIDLTERYGSLAADLGDLYRQLGYATLATLQGETVTVAVEDCVAPFHSAPPFVAAGTNYAEHAEEVYLDDPPFLFPKLASPSAWNAPVAYTARLDYEAEICAVPLADIRAPEEVVEFGLVLCNDFTDRWTLLRELDLDAPMGSTGFAAGKGRPGYLPTGYLLLIPRMPEFIDGITVELAVNGELRQRFEGGAMILTVADIVREAFRLADRDFYRGAERVQLLPHGLIPRGTLILTGTAAGVIFKPLNIWNQGFYLEPGDLVVTRATWLGELANAIERQP